MEDYSAAVEGQMTRFYRSLNERDRRRYAAVEAVKLGYGGIEYVASARVRSENHPSRDRRAGI